MMSDNNEFENIDLGVEEALEDSLVGSDLDGEDLLFFIEHGRKPNLVDKAWNKISILFRKMSSKLKETAAVVSGRKLADNKAYEGASRVSQEAVETEPRRWVIEECVPACQVLWDKNIYTFMCSDGLDDDAWICVEADCLSPENIDILKDITGVDYSLDKTSRGSLIASGKGINAQEELLRMAEQFVMQDVPDKYALLGREDLLKRCGCFVQVPNPDYVSIENLSLTSTDLDEMEEYHRRLYTPEFIKQLDESKVTKSLEEYAREVGAVIDPETGLIYESQFHYDKHLRYVESLGAKKGLK